MHHHLLSCSRNRKPTSRIQNRTKSDRIQLNASRYLLPNTMKDTATIDSNSTPPVHGSIRRRRVPISDHTSPRINPQILSRAQFQRSTDSFPSTLLRITDNFDYARQLTHVRYVPTSHRVKSLFLSIIFPRCAHLASFIISVS